MTILVVGAIGKTGRLVVEQLLAKNHQVRVVARSSHRLSAEVLENPNTTVIEASVLDLTDQEMAEQVKGCDAVVSCLGHIPDFKGMFGEPKKLCTDATRRLCDAIEQNGVPATTRFVLMNTVGVQNPDLNEKRTWFDRGLLASCVTPCLRSGIMKPRQFICIGTWEGRTGTLSGTASVQTR
jgi:nucleoside-diphosphate-sugar epimerase